MATALDCPFCSLAFPMGDVYWLQLHIEEQHTPDSEFKTTHDGEKGHSAPALSADEVDDGSDEFVVCPEAECGEYVLIVEFNDHLDLHDAERNNIIDIPTSSSSRSVQHDMRSNPSLLNRNISMNIPEQQRPQKRRRSSSTSKSALTRSILDLPSSSSTNSTAPAPKKYKSARLGKRELGPYAFEDRMPQWLEKKLKDGPKVSIVNQIGGDGRLIKQEVVENETPGLLQVLAQLSQADRAVRKAYYCHPGTVHICHTPKEGGFCGYRNLQMLLSYIQGAKAQGHTVFPGRTPSIPTIQDWIEEAWDSGINEIGRVQTGGIRRTRKWIGTPEVQAVLLNLQIQTGVQVFTDTDRGNALDQLLAFVENYFLQFTKDVDAKVHKTLAPPIYLQHPGHSLTIVGFERRKDGSGNIVVFDPMFKTSPSMHRLLGRTNISTYRPEVMDAYRRDGKKLRRHRDFEILMLTAPPPIFPAWAVMAHFPAHKFVYVFLRATATALEGMPGYDIYPEHHFLANFPWQNYGGLFITNEGRFARTPPALPIHLRLMMRYAFRGEPSPFSSPRESLDLTEPPAGPEETGLLPVKMLTDPELQEALFWQACGTLNCTFGCGKERMGEAEAAKRLFRPEEIVE